MNNTDTDTSRNYICECMSHSGKQPARLTQSSVASGFQAVRTPCTHEGCLSRGGWEKERRGGEGSLAGKPKLEPCGGSLETSVRDSWGHLSA